MKPNEVACPHCKVSAGQACLIPGTQQMLSLSAAHPSRMEVVGLRPEYGAVNRYRAMFDKPPEEQK